MTEPPILTGEAAALNRAKRELSGKFTPEDRALWVWVLLNCDKLIIPRKSDGMDNIVMHMGEQIWPPL